MTATTPPPVLEPVRDVGTAPLPDAEPTRRRVVVVDDAPDLRELITLVLGRRGGGAWNVVGSAGDGISAVEVVHELRPDVVLLDIAMPVMDGLQALPLVRRACPEATIVMLSAFPSSSAQVSALAAGADAYLEKDDLVATLVPKLAALLDAGGLAAPAAG